jgi:hypothetical protein
MDAIVGNKSRKAQRAGARRLEKFERESRLSGSRRTADQHRASANEHG